MKISLLSYSLFFFNLFYLSYADSDSDIDDLDYEIWDLMDAALELFGPGLTWYEIFDTDESATPADIQKKYRKFSIKFHPDKNPSKLAAKKFQCLAGMAKILKDERARERYDYWLENGIPYWRGQGYYFRKGEKLSLLQTMSIVIIGAAIMQYVTMIVRYMQIKAGLNLLQKEREKLAVIRSNGVSLSKKTKQEAKKKRYSEESLSDQALGVFDDANMKQALDWLVFQHDIAPEVVFDYKEWNAMVKEDFDGDESVFKAKFPSPLSTFVFSIPVSLLGRLFRRNAKDKEE